MFSLDYPDADARRFVSSQEDLAAALGVSRRRVCSLLKIPGNPGKTANGSYPLRAWKEFYAAERERVEKEEDDRSVVSLSGGSADEKAELRAAVLRERRAKAEKAELEAARLRGELVAAADVEKTVVEWSARLKGIHHRVATTDAVNALATELALDSEQTGKLLLFMEKFHDRFCAEVSADGGEEN